MRARYSAGDFMGSDVNVMQMNMLKVNMWSLFTRRLKQLSMLSLVLSSAVAQAESLQIREGYVRELPPGQSTSAAFMDVVNGSDRPVAIVAAVSDVSQSAEVHQHKHVNGSMSMEQVRRLVIPPRDHVLFAPGGYHLMLINLKRSLRAGDNVTITLLDEEGKSYTAHIPVVKIVGAGK